MFDLDIKRLSIHEIKELVQFSTLEDLRVLLELIKLDDRKGVRTLQRVILKRFEDEEARLKRRKVLLEEERKLWAMGYEFVGGLDEAGRGPLAGPVVAACVVFEPDTYIDGVNDSKRLTPAKREKYFEMIMEKARIVGIGRVDPKEIDSINILEATRTAMEHAVSQCYPDIDFLLVDAMDGNFSVPYIPLIKGDSRSHSIAAASIVAKVIRDREMDEWHKKYPQYGFNKHKGYGTGSHIDVIRQIGPCPIHRRTFIHKLID